MENNTVIEEKDNLKPSMEVSIDTIDKDMLYFQESGGILHFDSTPGKFKVLSEDLIKELNHANTRNYWLSYSSWIQELKEKENPPVKGVQVLKQPTASRASARMEVTGKKPGMNYAFMRPDQIPLAGYAGWRACEDPNIETFCKQPDNTHKLISPTEPGVTEQVLMEISNELYVKNVERPLKEKNAKRLQGPDNKLRSETYEAGAKPYEEKPNSNIRWREEPHIKE